MTAATIAVVPYPEMGHLNGCLGFARALQRRGHRVLCLVTEDFADHVRRQGFEVDTILTHDRPAGTSSRAASSLAAHRGLSARLHSHAHNVQLFSAVAREPLDGRFQALGVDLVLADRELPGAALLAHRAGIPICLLSTSLSVRRDDGAPPITSGARGRGSRDWLSLGIQRLLVERLGDALGVAPWRPHYDALADACGFPRAWLEEGHGSRPELALPMLILCPGELDLPQVRRSIERDPLRCYGAPYIDEQRCESPLPAALERVRGPMVLCSMGSQAHRLPSGLPFFRRLVEAFGTLPGLQLVLALAPEHGSRVLGPLPANVHVLPTVPQLRVLQRATAMITHAGLNSVKECIMSSVPMLAVPTAYDQPGNAARVLHHGLGVLGGLDSSTAELTRLITRVVGDPLIRRAMGRMAGAFHERQRAQAGIWFVERLLDAGEPPASMPRQAVIPQS